MSSVRPPSAAAPPPPVSLAAPAGRPEAAEAIWRWQAGEPAAGAADGGARRARVRGLLQAAAAATAGAALLFFSLRVPAWIAFGLATTVGLSALLAPRSLYAGIERLFLALGHWTGRALGWVLLVPVFYLFFAPFGRLLRRGRRDRLQRFLDPDAPSYWEPHEGLRTASSSPRRQY